MSRHTTLTAEQRIARMTERHRKWQQEHRELTRVYTRRYRSKKKAALKEVGVNETK